MDTQELFAIARNPESIVYHDEDLGRIQSQKLRDMLQGLKDDSLPTSQLGQDILAQIRKRNQNGTI